VIHQNEMVRSSECGQNHVQTVLDSADIVRERIYQHLSTAANCDSPKPIGLFGTVNAN